MHAMSPVLYTRYVTSYPASLLNDIEVIHAYDHAALITRELALTGTASIDMLPAIDLLHNTLPLKPLIAKH